MIDPKFIAVAFTHPMTGKFFHKATMSYHYLLGGIKFAEHAYLSENDPAWPEIDRMIWNNIIQQKEA